MPKISNLTLVTPTLLDRNPILDDADNLTKAQNNQGLRDLLVQNIFTPQGHLLNGRILPSVTNFNLTLALKTYAGTDPSATDFVIANIGGTLRKISSALSVTLALGTNWMNLGSAELATIETDLFAYLGYNATDGITIGYSRIPGAKVYSDFSITTTNEKYLAVSNRTTASANDPYEVIGRFSAILSLTPFNWSVPTYTALNLIQKPIYDTRWMDWNAQFTANGSMTIASLVKAGAKYKITNDTLAFNSKHSMTLGGSGSNQIYATAPFGANISNTYMITGSGTLYTGTLLLTTNLFVNNATINSFASQRYDGANFGLGASQEVVMNANYRI